VKRKSPRREVHRAASRRTTLTFPAGLLDRAERIAAERRQSLSAVISDLVENALETRHSLAERNADARERWKKAFAGLTAEEMMLWTASSWVPCRIRLSALHLTVGGYNYLRGARPR